jgi:hypothetical protein
MKITNIAFGPRGFWANHRLVTLAPGESVEKDLTKEELAGVKGAPESFEVDGGSLDHDKDGKKGGSTAPEQTDELADLRAQYADLYGKRPFMGWDAKTLTAKIDEKLAE